MKSGEVVAGDEKLIDVVEGDPVLLLEFPQGGGPSLELLFSISGGHRRRRRRRVAQLAAAVRGAVGFAEREFFFLVGRKNKT